MRRLFTTGRREHEPTRTGPLEIVLHVGLHKTGSTLLQRLLREARTDLQTRSVVVRPRDDLYGDREFLRVVRGLHTERPANDAMMTNVTHRARELLHPRDEERVVFSDETSSEPFPTSNALSTHT